MRATLLLLVLATITLQAEPPVIGQATLYPGPNGSTTIGFFASGMTREQAAAATWVLEVDGQAINSGRGECAQYYALPHGPLCQFPVPLMAHVGAVRIRLAGSSEWSNVWPMAMVPCGAFVGETLFSKGHELMGWMPSFPLPVGAPCAGDTPPADPPSSPDNLRIVK
jgi:hypothetical protein